MARPHSYMPSRILPWDFQLQLYYWIKMLHINKPCLSVKRVGVARTWNQCIEDKKQNLHFVIPFSKLFKTIVKNFHKVFIWKGGYIVPASYSFEQCHYAMLHCTYSSGFSFARTSTETTIGLISCNLITIIWNEV